MKSIDIATRNQIRALVDSGESIRSAARSVGIRYATAWHYVHHRDDTIYGTLDDLDTLETIFLQRPSKMQYKSKELPAHLLTADYKDLREGILWYQHGFGWTLHKDWQSAIADHRLHMRQRTEGA